jgi:hypothetical protein
MNTEKDVKNSNVHKVNPAHEVSSLISREQIRIANLKEKTKPARDTIREYAHLAELVAIYLAEQNRPEDQSSLKALIWMAGHMKAWVG